MQSRDKKQRTIKPKKGNEKKKPDRKTSKRKIKVKNTKKV